jgi:hypothetical protein
MPPGVQLPRLAGVADQHPSIRAGSCSLAAEDKRDCCSLAAPAHLYCGWKIKAPSLSFVTTTCPFCSVRGGGSERGVTLVMHGKCGGGKARAWPPEGTASCCGTATGCAPMHMLGMHGMLRGPGGHRTHIGLFNDFVGDGCPLVARPHGLQLPVGHAVQQRLHHSRLRLHRGRCTADCGHPGGARHASSGREEAVAGAGCRKLGGRMAWGGMPLRSSPAARLARHHTASRARCMLSPRPEPVVCPLGGRGGRRSISRVTLAQSARSVRP